MISCRFGSRIPIAGLIQYFSASGFGGLAVD
jgi:hypothetical protein